MSVGSRLCYSTHKHYPGTALYLSIFFIYNRIQYIDLNSNFLYIGAVAFQKR
ncbi:hypothetical protein SAMN06265218_10283 [Fodinibius sediminis]|uniref:Uncharacterized protein n=1 Tax=Fodinibius sediminis TaxID=1214077 RepID=A0A521B194_9BACT|nr:hypothetical protein SAMN06265218_10283 [Fodinibius sediminis]